MTGNLIGETFDQVVFDQIKARQKLYGSGFSNNSKISTNELQLLNNNNSFLKLASGVNLYTPVAEMTEEEFRETDDYRTAADLQYEEVDGMFDIGSMANNLTTGVFDYFGISASAQAANEADLADINNQIKANNLLQRSAAEQKLKRIGLSENLIRRLGIGNKLAKELVLFGGTSRLSEGKLKQREGINKGISAWNNNAYGLGGSKFGKQPMPAIISAEIDCINRGSIRSATVNIKAFNQYQFDLIELLYLRLGYTMLLEWGHVNYIDNDDKRVKTSTTITEKFWFTNGPHDQSEVLDQIKTQVRASNGNLDAFFGRVTNFNWSIDSDGSYDITLELYTVGDVIESLTVNVPVDLQPVNTEGEGKSLTILDKWMDTTVATMKQNNRKSMGALTQGDGEKNYNYINLPEYNDNNSNPIYKLVEGWDENNSYFCTFRTLIEKIEEHTIPVVIGKTNKPLVTFNTSIKTNIMAAQPNQVSFDLETCFVKPDLFFDGANPLQTFTNNDYFEYHVYDPSANDNLYYGQIMNIYLNFKFIKKQLRRNVDSEGKLSLYKFLQGICSGINSALGDVNQLQPIIKDDNTIVFIDQVQPRGSEEIIQKLVPQIPVINQTPFLLYGFKQNKSNFIYDFSFESNIDSKLSSKIAISATAGNSSATIIDGTDFSSWNTGLQDRFAKEILPASQIIDTAALEQDQEDEREEKLKKVWDGRLDGTDDIETSNPWNFGEDERSGRWGEFSWTSLTFSEFKEAYDKFKRENPDLRSRTQFESQVKKINYPEWLVYTFSGDANNTTNVTSYNADNAVGMKIKDKSIYNQGKSAFKLYIKQRDERIFKYTNTSSGQSGFIPLNLRLNMWGLSGVKIYQKLPIDISFLPTQYTSLGKDESDPNLNFVVMGVNHKISDNRWETSLETLSINRKPAIDVNVIDNSIFTFLGISTAPSEFSAYAQDVAWSAYFISWLNENIASAGTNRFPSSGNHMRYSQNIRSGGTNWFVYDPREGDRRSSYTLDRSDTDNKRSINRFSKFNIDTLYSDTYTKNNYTLDKPNPEGDGVYWSSDTSPGAGYLDQVKPGDIIVKQRDDEMYYWNNPWQGPSHGDLVVEVTSTKIRVIGGNVGNTVRYSEYEKTIDNVTTTGGNEAVYKTKGAIKYVDEGQKVICALRCNDQNIANELVALAKVEEEKWRTNNWTDASAGAYETLRGYYLAANGRPPTISTQTEEAT